MLICVRTTVVIDDVLLQRAKEAAAKSGSTLSDVINRALAESLAARETAKPPFEMITYGGSGRAEHEPADFSAALDEEDSGVAGA